MTDNKLHRWRHVWVWLLVAGYIFLIFRNSMMIAEVSDGLSSKVAYYLMNILQRFGMYTDFDIFHHYVRKLAHFTEFAGLGFLVGWAMHMCPLLPSRFLNFTLFLLLIPFSDEMLQRFVEGRSSQFSDMLIDGSGILFGGFVIYVLILIWNDLFHHQKNKRY